MEHGSEEVYPRRTEERHRGLGRYAAVVDRVCDLEMVVGNFAAAGEVAHFHSYVAAREQYRLERYVHSYSFGAVLEGVRAGPSAVNSSFALYRESPAEYGKSLSEIDRREARRQKCSGKPHLADR